MKKLFNNGWSFVKTEYDCSYEKAMACKSWSPVDIPHDFLIYQANDLYETCFGWYKKSFEIEDTNKVYKLWFGGVYMDSTLYINGKKVGDWHSGYSSFEFDISGYVQKGSNTAVVQVRHHHINSRWYSGAGIYRNVYIIQHDCAYLCSEGVYFSAKPVNGAWNIRLSAETEKTDAEHKIAYKIYNESGVLLTAEGKCGEEITAEVSSPEIWDVDSPSLYTLETKLVKNGEVCDEQSCNIGFREISFDTEKGFFLNGRNLKIHGVCLHHDLGCLGSAVNKKALERQLRSMKRMGANAVRTSHNMPSVELMELCDELGILVDDEAFDIWELKKNDYDYARFFPTCWQQDVRSWVRRDRNHPSVIMWSIGNEIYDTHASERGAEVTRMLRDEVRRNDPHRNGFTTMGSNYMEWDGAQKCTEDLDLAGYNYGERLYEQHHKKYPHWKIYGSETGWRMRSRGVYHFPKSSVCHTHDDLQCSSLENCSAGVADQTVQTSIIVCRDTPFCAGQFIWSGSDYIGEPTPYSTKNSYCGQIDTAGFLKDSYYLFQAAWTDKTVLHILPACWDYNLGQLIDAMVYTNQPFAELFINGRSLGRKEINGVYSADWQLPYEEGELKAVSYDKDGNITAEDSVRSFGDTAELRISADKTILSADGTDLAFLDISAFDKNGVFVSNARNRVNVSVAGAGLLAGLDSGDSTDYEEYKGTSKKLFSGKLLAVIRAKNTAGDINVRITSPGLPAAEIVLSAEEAEFPEGASDTFAEIPYRELSDVPVRKIELSVSSQHLNGDCRTAEVTAKVFPENADHEIEWKAVTVNGVKTNIASVEGNGRTAVVKAEGDGFFRLRCFSRNGKPDPEVISEIEMDIEGIGAAVIDPYKEYVKGSLYNMSLKELNEVTYGGVNIEPDGKNIVGFRNVDFGRSGSDRMSVDMICWFNNDPVDFSLWLGMPHEKGSEKLGDFIYRADFTWQTYITNDYRLPRRLKGLQDICFEFAADTRRIYFGGFIFEGGDPYSEIFAADNTEIYGDSFTLGEKTVEHIGNNVYIDFEGFDLYSGVSSVTIKGRTHNVKDSVHIRIIGDDSELRGMAEFTSSDHSKVISFTSESFKGHAKVRFEFLPGCDFDLESFIIEPETEER